LTTRGWYERVDLVAGPIEPTLDSEVDPAGGLTLDVPSIDPHRRRAKEPLACGFLDARDTARDDDLVDAAGVKCIPHRRAATS
jgi:hypothetical protein